jgi:hypothetical protein
MKLDKSRVKIERVLSTRYDHRKFRECCDHLSCEFTDSGGFNNLFIKDLGSCNLFLFLFFFILFTIVLLATLLLASFLFFLFLLVLFLLYFKLSVGNEKSHFSEDVTLFTKINDIDN